MKKYVLWVLLLFALLPGCAVRESSSPTQSHLVVAIDAAYQDGVIQLDRHYTDPEKMRQILNYLRLIDPLGTAADESAGSGSRVEILLTYSDGNTKLYQQRDNHLLKEADGPWQNIDPEKGQELGLLLGLMESDQ